MKYGLIVFKESQNIGDDIQSYAAIQYLPQIDYYIEREEMDSFVSKNGEPVKTIMNGWFLHSDIAWPPSPYINPLIIGAHFTNRLNDEKPLYLDEVGLNYLKDHHPIGLRDNLLKKHFDQNKISTYFSGCLTMCIKKFSNVQKEDKIILVDVGEEIEEFVLNNTDKKVEFVTHKLNNRINNRLSYEERMKNVEDLLIKYQGASLVISTRLHCVLPCLALGVPVILIYDESNIDVKNRLGDYLPYLNHSSAEDFIKKNGKKYLVKSPTNSFEYKKLVEIMERECKNFISNNSVKEIIIDNEIFYNNFVNSRNRIKRIYTKMIENQNSLLTETNKYNESLKLFNDTLEAENILLRETTKDLNIIKKNNEKFKKELLEIEKKNSTLILQNDAIFAENHLVKDQIVIFKYDNSNLRNQLDEIIYSRSYKLYRLIKNMISKEKK